MGTTVATQEQEAMFEAWLESMLEDYTLEQERIPSVVADLREHREMIALRTADYFAEAPDPDEPAYVLFVRAAPDVFIEADDDLQELMAWGETVGVRVTPHIYSIVGTPRS